MLDLGWLNNRFQAKTIRSWTQICEGLGHSRSDHDQTNHRGMDHVVTCDRCGYQFHYDSSD